MHPDYFEIMEGGMAAQLARLPLDEVVTHLDNQLSNFLLDEPSVACYVNRLSADPALAQNPKGLERYAFLVQKYVQIFPFDPDVLKEIEKLTGDSRFQLVREISEKTNPEPETLRQIRTFALQGEHGEARSAYKTYLHSFPYCVQAAQLLLGLDNSVGVLADDWVGQFKCPSVLKKQWHELLLTHYAALSATELAMELWEQVDETALGEYALNAMAEVFVRAGDQERGMELYRRSLQLDSFQVPVRLRLGELDNPFPVRPELLRERKVAVYLYCWNKGDILRETLRFLAKSDLGNAEVTLLLNGCTDHSPEVAAEARQWFGDRLEVIELPINIGAPAARTWLINRDQTWNTDYVAFLDDDVTVEPDWLARLVTVAEADLKAGVVGGKIIDPVDSPDSPALIQYLCRYVSIADHGLLKLSLQAPIGIFDNGLYAYVRQTRSVMGCMHLFRTQALKDVPNFDIRFSPSQVDDLDHDLELGLKGWNAWYCGTSTCTHHQSSGIKMDRAFEGNKIGNVIGNDVKLFWKHADHLAELAKLDNLSLTPLEG